MISEGVSSRYNLSCLEINVRDRLIPLFQRGQAGAGALLPFPVPLSLFLRDLGIDFSPFACIEIYKCTIKTQLHRFLSTYLCKISFPETVGKRDFCFVETRTCSVALADLELTL